MYKSLAWPWPWSWSVGFLITSSWLNSLVHHHSVRHCFGFFFSHGILIIHTYHIYIYIHIHTQYIYIDICSSLNWVSKKGTHMPLFKRLRCIRIYYGNTWSNALIYIHHIAFLHTHMHIYIQIAIIWFCTYNM